MWLEGEPTARIILGRHVGRPARLAPRALAGARPLAAPGIAFAGLSRYRNGLVF
jgi:hypothetical protein